MNDATIRVAVTLTQSIMIVKEARIDGAVIAQWSTSELSVQNQAEILIDFLGNYTP